MKQKELELKIAAPEKEIAELKKREPVIIYLPQNPICPLQHYPIYPQIYPPYLINYPFTTCIYDSTGQ